MRLGIKWRSTAFFLSLLLAVGFQFVWSNSSEAQVREFKIRGELANGSFTQITPAQVEFKFTEGLRRLEVHKDLNVKITGNAEVDFIPYIKAPLMLQFDAEMSSNNKQPSGKITELEIVVASDKVKRGIARDIDVQPAPGQKKSVTQPATYLIKVTGVPQSFNKNMLQIEGKKFEIDPAAKIKVRCESPMALAVLPLNEAMDITYGYPENPQNKPIPPFFLLAVNYRLPKPWSAELINSALGIKPKGGKANSSKTGADKGKEEKPAADKSKSEKTEETKKDADKPKEDKDKAAEKPKQKK